MNLLEETKLVLRQHGFSPSRREDQNFLVREEVIRRQVGYAEVGRRDVVLEIGAGIGNLTRYLLEKAGKVIAVEKNPVLIDILRKRLGNRENLVLIQGDAVKVDLPFYDKVVSNIPYSISSPITFRILKRGFKIGVLTYQKEFAERLVARPGMRNYSRLSVAAYYYARVRVLEYLPPGVFYPPPEVTSAIVELLPKKPPFKVNEDLFFEVVRSLFIHRGKTLRSAVIHSPMFPLKEEKKEFIKTLGETLSKKRVFQLTPEELASLTKNLERWKK